MNIKFENGQSVIDFTLEETPRNPEELKEMTPANSFDIILLVKEYEVRWTQTFKKMINEKGFIGKFPQLCMYELDQVEMENGLLKFLNTEILPPYLMIVLGEKGNFDDPCENPSRYRLRANPSCFN